ncbi:MAG: GNAT family N-acetyltransferase [Deinococcaceae bacterium]
MYIKRRFSPASDDHTQALALRFQILREPLGLSFSQSDLEKDLNDLHFGTFDGTTLVACLTLTPEPDQTIKMRQVAVSEALQGQGVGGDLVRFAELEAKTLGFERMFCHARETAVSFYKKLGYAVVGKPFIEVTLPHRKMEKSL